ncbi:MULTISPECIES: hypothetical protein [Acinetobacter]|uniref:Uncharacterized protein n=1 Tax=Acinetobacter soli TaxID=487316 RepID=A0A1P8EL59_9GAMM|nr:MULTISPECIES: hypothetical protein [Acinetobacter]APV36938.1 hypothetical protein BEN76_13305 [Acinetobacter soli]ENV58481.1 hypothetical protein F951_00426 [Acinetobacter soli CIP 110264]KOR15592.1 hypothetical protein ABW55_08250 [Acinetobacter sp. C15]MBO3641069.1 hypothetical protein [Acinetobacter soli]MBO3673353.1 hypothetical protein [Acinetobacter soli]
MKKLALMSLVCAGVALTAVGCASEAGLNASGSAQTTSSPQAGVQGGVAAEAGASTQTQQPVQAAPEMAQPSTDASTIQ